MLIAERERLGAEEQFDEAGGKKPLDDLLGSRQYPRMMKRAPGLPQGAQVADPFVPLQMVLAPQVRRSWRAPAPFRETAEKIEPAVHVPRCARTPSG